MKLCAFADEAGASICEQISALKRNNIELLEIRGVDAANIKDIPASKAKEIRQQLDSNGIRVWSVGSPIGKYSLALDMAPHLEDYKRVLENTEILGANHIRIFSFFPAEGESERETEYKVLERLDTLCSITPKNIVLCHENEKNIFGETPEKCLKLHQALPRLRAVFDPANFVQCGVDTVEAWQILQDCVEYLHIKDAVDAATNVPAGEGLGKIPEIIRLFRAQGGTVLTLEPHLSHFVGFCDLEQNPSTKTFFYANQSEAFDAGVSALNTVLGGL